MRKKTAPPVREHFLEFLGRKYLVVVFALLLVLLPTGFAQTASSATANLDHSGTAPSIKWEQTYSTGDASNIEAMVQTSDGGYALAGMGMYIIVGDIGFWLVKTNSTGNEQWDRSYISNQMNVNLGGASALVQTSDGGYALAGSVYNFTYLVKTDSQGNLQWRQCYGGIGWAGVSSLIETSDGEFVMVGSNGGDCWLAKVNSTGQMLWSRTYADENISEGISVVQTSDGGFAIVGMLNPYSSECRAWLIKTDSFGYMLWNRTYDGPSGDFEPTCLIQTNNGGYVLAGSTDTYFPNGVDVNRTVFLIKTNSDGKMLWNQTYSELGNEAASAVIQTSDGGYALGCSASLVKTDSDGNLQWSIACNGTVCSVVQASDGGYVFAGSNFLIGTAAASAIPLRALQTPSSTILPMQSPQSLSSSAYQSGNKATTYIGYYLALAAAIAVATLIVIAIATMIRRSNAWPSPGRNTVHKSDSERK